MIYVQLFLAFLRVGLFSFGGGLAALPLIEREVVTHFAWLSHREFLELITLSELTPGPIAINSATFTGFKVGGMGGAVVATCAFCLPSFLLVLLLSHFLSRFREIPWVEWFLQGLRPAVLALLVSVAYSFLVRGMNSVFAAVLGITGLVLFVRFRKVNPVWALLFAGFLGVWWYR